MAKVTVADIPHMLKTWDRELNKEAPEDVSANCTDQKYWRCPDCGYDWQSSPKARYRGSGKCPCHESNKAIKRGVNDVLTLVKGLEALLDEDNNFDEICRQGVDSKLPVNYKCDECGRKWTASLKSQIKKDGNGGYVAAGCPHYNTVKRKKDDVPFCTEVDAIIRFWDDKNSMDPATTRSNSTDSAHFICKDCGYDWTTEIRAQTRGTGKCKCCELQMVTRKGVTDVFTLIPESRRFYDFNKNKDIDIYTIPLRDMEHQIDWKCPDCGREWNSPLAGRVKGKKGEYSFAGCQECYVQGLRERITPVASVPRLMKYWDFKKNKGIDPNLISIHADIPVHWRCKACGYEWTEKISKRTNSIYSCPSCDGKRKPVIKGQNDVLTLCPEFTEIYDFEYNERNGIDIYELGATSTIEAHFKCRKCGNEWDSPIYKRVKKNDNGTYRLVNCSACSHGLFRKVPYSVEFPLLAKMYREDLNNVPLDEIRGAKAISHTYYHWDCPDCGETFESTLNAMKDSHKSPTKGCPYCSRTKLRKGESFAELHPELMDEYDPDNAIDPYTVFPNCKDSAGWICRDCGHHWGATFALRHDGGGNCPVCNRSVLIPDKNSFAAVYPERVKYWADSNERKPNEVFYNSSVWFRFICPTCSNEHGAYIEDFVAENNCPYCKGIMLSPEMNSLKAVYPDIVRRWSENNSFEPDTIFPTAHAWAKWICDTCKCEYPALVKDVVNGIDECPYCAGKRLSPETNSLKVVHPDICRKWSPNNIFGPEMVLPTSSEWVQWICETCGEEYGSHVKDVVNGTDECPYCTGKRLSSKKNSLKVLFPDIARRWSPNNDFGPEMVLPTSGLRIRWICDECACEYGSYVKDVVNGTDECPYCAGRRLLPELNSLKAVYPDIARRWSPNNDFGPEMVLPTSSERDNIVVTPHLHLSWIYRYN